MAEALFYYTCCNPLGKPNHSSRRKNLRDVLPWMRERVASIPVGAKICDECRKYVGKLPIPESVPASSDSDEEEGEIPGGIGDADFESLQAMKSQEYAEPLQGINDCLRKVGQTPIIIVAHKLGQVKYPKQKLKKITKSFKKVMLKDPSSSSDEEGTMLRQLKEKFHTSSSRSEKIQVLTVLPMGWSIRRVQDEFEASDYMVRRAKELVRQKGILSTPDLCHGHPLSSATTELVHSFYNNDDVSRMMPGKKDFISVMG